MYVGCPYATFCILILANNFLYAETFCLVLFPSEKSES